MDPTARLRNAHVAVVDRRKVRDYLLNAAHSDNGGKAQFFQSLGFHAGDPDTLAAALLVVAQSGTVVRRLKSRHGEKFVVDGVLAAQTGTKQPRAVRTVWIVDASSESPRLVTAYPAQE